MSRPVALYCCPEADELQARHTNAFLLLLDIARHAKTADCSITGLRCGQVEVDWKRAGILTRKICRTAVEVLKRCGYASFEVRSNRTIATILPNPVVTVGPLEGHLKASGSHSESNGYDDSETSMGQQRATRGPLEGHLRASTKNSKPKGSDDLKTPVGQRPARTSNSAQIELLLKGDEGQAQGQQNDSTIIEFPTTSEASEVAQGQQEGQHHDSYGGGRGGSVRSVHLQNEDKSTKIESTHTLLETKSPEKGLVVKKAGKDKSPPDPIAEQAHQIQQAYARRDFVDTTLPIIYGQLKAGEDFEQMLAGTKACAAVIFKSPAGPNGRYVPGAQSFFIGKRWKDDPETIIRYRENESSQHREQKKESEFQAEELKVKRL